jgi:hypothetical protein
MTALSTTRSSPAQRTGTVSLVLRWMVTFAGFPLGGVAARLIAGPIDDTLAACVGGLVSGAVLGAAQSWGFGRLRPPVGRWITATSLGLMVGLGVGATAVDFATDGAALVAQGAVCGLAVGVAQALVLRHRSTRLAVGWPLALGVSWAAGWAITVAAGVQVDEQFTVFGTSGAIVVTAVTAVLPLALSRQERGA